MSIVAPPRYHVVHRLALGTIGNGYVADFIVVDQDHRRLYGLGRAVLDLEIVSH